MSEDRYFSDNLMEPQQPANVDVDSERAVLCLCLKHEKALEKCGRSLVKDDFSDTRNSVIFEAIFSLYMESRRIDRYTVADLLEDKGLLGKAGGREYLYDIGDMVAVISNIDDYIGSVVEKSRLRKLNQTLARFVQMAASGRHKADAIIDQTVTELSGMRAEDDGIGFEKLDKILKDTFNTIREVSSGNAKRNVDTGFKYLDQKMGGMAPGSLNIIAARPGMGKTAFAINIATNVARSQHMNVNFFSLEMSKAEIGNRVLAAHCNTTSRDLQRANLPEEMQNEVLSAIKTLQDLNIYVDDKSDLNPVTMLSKLKELKSAGKLGLVIVDYIQLMGSGTNRAGANRQSEISDISRSLKLMAKEMGVPIIALSQLSRGAEKRDDHTPMLSDLRDSGAIEQDADTVIFIDRPDYYNKEERKEIVDAHIILAKNRKGETGKVTLKWWGKKTLFFDEKEENSRPEDPEVTGAAKKSSFTRTTSGAAASANFALEEEEYATGVDNGGPVPPPAPPPFDMDDPGMPPPPPPPEPEPEDTLDDLNADNDEYFSDSHDDFPAGMMDD
ncbi:replicative DNA helicase [Ruminococcaceae bacterium YRB3002]|nr:replicative DNA helicase [Ruminococcaceae bacterium YRB3002]